MEAARAVTWLYGQLRYPPAPSLREKAMRLFYGLLHAVRYSSEEKPVLPDFRCAYGARAEARARCKTPDDFIVALPFGGEPLGDDIQKSPTFCRPRHPHYRAQDERDSRLYVEDLHSRLCEETAAQLATLKAEIAELEEVGRQV